MSEESRKASGSEESKGRRGADPSAMMSAGALEDQIQRLSQVASHPAVIAAIKELGELPEGERLNAAREIATPQALQERGVPLPDGFRVTTRYFEEPGTQIQNQIKLGEMGAPSVVDDLQRSAPDVLETIYRSRPDIYGELEGIPSQTATALTVCGSVGYIVCVSVGG